ncbi:MAG: nucleotidyl transferase AbiEii/AbiGii toxin family protein [Pirellulales bacterium]
MERLGFLRDIKKLVIVAMFSDDELMGRLVLKGGNLLDIVYQLSARASVDVDLSMNGEFEDVHKLRIKVFSALEATFREHGYVIFDFKLTEEPPKLSDNMKDFWGGYRIRFKLIDEKKHRTIAENIEDLRKHAAVVGEKGSTVFQIDISKHEFCDDKQLFNLDDHSVYGYSPEMFVAEKLRAICQQMDEYVQLVKLHPRPRPKDFVDIQIITQHYGIDFTRDDFRELVRQTFAIKKVPLSLFGKIHKTRDFHKQGYPAVRDTVYPHFDLQDFDYYFDYVVRNCELLESLWHV